MRQTNDMMECEQALAADGSAVLLLTCYLLAYWAFSCC